MLSAESRSSARALVAWTVWGSAGARVTARRGNRGQRDELVLPEKGT